MPKEARTCRQRTAAETRSRLFEAGRRAFASKGFAGTKLTHDILEPAGVSVGSFYHQFQDKTALLLAIFEEHGEKIRSQVHEAHDPLAGRSARKIARDALARVFDLADRDINGARIMLRENGCEDPRIRQAIADDRRRWRESVLEDYRRLSRAKGFSLDVELAQEVMSAAVRGVLAYYLDLPAAERPTARERLTDGLSRLIVGGFAALRPSEEQSSTPRTRTADPS